MFDEPDAPSDAKIPSNPIVPAIGGQRQSSADFQASVLEAFQQYVHEYIDAVERQGVRNSLAFWTDLRPYTLPVDGCAALVYSQLLSEEITGGELDEHGRSANLQSEAERSALPVELQLRSLPVSCLHARLTSCLTAEPECFSTTSIRSPARRAAGSTKPEEAEDGSIKIRPCWDATVLEGREVPHEDVEFGEGSLGLQVATNEYFGQSTNAEDAYAVFVDGFNQDGDGKPGPAEASGKVMLGDFIVAVAGQSVRGQSDTDVLGCIKAARRPVVISFCRPKLLDQSDGAAVVSFGGTVPAHVVSRSYPGWGTTTSAVFAWDTELLEKVMDHAAHGSRVSLELPCKIFGQRPASVRHRLRVIDSAQISVSPEVQPTLTQVVDTPALADAVFGPAALSGDSSELAQFSICAWTQCVTVVIPDAIVKRTVAAKALVVVVEEMPASALDPSSVRQSGADSLRQLGGQFGTVVYATAAHADDGLWDRCASLALAPLPLSSSYKSEESCVEQAAHVC